MAARYASSLPPLIFTPLQLAKGGSTATVFVQPTVLPLSGNVVVTFKRTCEMCAVGLLDGSFLQLLSSRNMSDCSSGWLVDCGFVAAGVLPDGREVVGATARDDFLVLDSKTLKPLWTFEQTKIGSPLSRCLSHSWSNFPPLFSGDGVVLFGVLCPTEFLGRTKQSIVAADATAGTYLGHFSDYADSVNNRLAVDEHGALWFAAGGGSIFQVAVF